MSMQGKKIFAIISMCSALTVSVPALAFISVPCGIYVEGNVGQGNLSGKTYPGSTTSNRIAGGVNVGYKFLPFFGLEVGGNLYPYTNINAPDGSRAAQDKHYAFGGAAKGILPLYDSGFELFAKLGVYSVNSSVTITNAAAASQIGIGRTRSTYTGAFIGLGGQYYFMPELAVVAQWQRANGNRNTGTFDFYSIGLSFIID